MQIELTGKHRFFFGEMTIEKLLSTSSLSTVALVSDERVRMEIRSGMGEKTAAEKDSILLNYVFIASD